MTRRGVQQFDSAGSCYKIKYESEVTFMATIIKGSTKRGKGLIATFDRYEGYYITDVYDRPSTAKENAWSWCFEKFAKTENSEEFHICSFNTFNFTVGWLGKWDGESAIFLETRDNSYIVLLDK